MHVRVWEVAVGELTALLLDGLGWRAVAQQPVTRLALSPEAGVHWRTLRPGPDPAYLASARGIGAFLRADDHLLDARRRDRGAGVEINAHVGAGEDRQAVADRIFYLIVHRTNWPVEAWSGSGVRRARLRTPSAQQIRGSAPVA